MSFKKYIGFIAYKSYGLYFVAQSPMLLSVV